MKKISLILIIVFCFPATVFAAREGGFVTLLSEDDETIENAKIKITDLKNNKYIATISSVYNEDLGETFDLEIEEVINNIEFTDEENEIIEYFLNNGNNNIEEECDKRNIMCHVSVFSHLNSYSIEFSNTMLIETKNVPEGYKNIKEEIPYYDIVHIIENKETNTLEIENREFWGTQHTFKLEKADYKIEKKINGSGNIEVVKESIFGDIVTFTVAPKEGYVLGCVKVIDANGNTIVFTQNTFTMPSADVIIEAEFIKEVANANTVDIPIIMIAFITMISAIVILTQVTKMKNMI